MFGSQVGSLKMEVQSGRAAQAAAEQLHDQPSVCLMPMLSWHSR